MFSCLIVEDEKGLLNIIRRRLNDKNRQLYSAQTISAAYSIIEELAPDILLTDLKLGSDMAYELIRAHNLRVPSGRRIVLTSYVDLDHALKAMKAGAQDFVSKTQGLDKIDHIIDQQEHLLKKESTALTAAAEIESMNLLPDLKETFTRFLQMLNQGDNIMILGETGSGKSWIAEYVHRQGPRAKKPFVTFNCGAFPENLIEVEFFGAAKGSYTGSINTKIGIIEEADGGTLFLDEVGDIPLSTQVSLLNVIETGKFKRIGDSKTRTSNIQIISATNQPIGNLVYSGKIREDFFWRMGGLTVDIPPLRDRKNDIVILAKYFLFHIDINLKLTNGAEKQLLSYTFPGNIRELKWILTRCALNNSSEINADHITQAINDMNSLIRRKGSETQENRDPSSKTTQNVEKSSLESTQEKDKAGKQSSAFTIKDWERHAIHEAIKDAGGNKTKAAKILGISRRSFYDKLRKYYPDLIDS